MEAWASKLLRASKDTQRFLLTQPPLVRWSLEDGNHRCADLLSNVGFHRFSVARSPSRPVCRSDDHGSIESQRGFWYKNGTAKIMIP